jgi:hypothetical protein
MGHEDRGQWDWERGEPAPKRTQTLFKLNRDCATSGHCPLFKGGPTHCVFCGVALEKGWGDSPSSADVQREKP